MESLNTLTNVELQDKNDYSNNLTFKNIEHTPFTIVKQNNEYYGLIGNHRITEIYLDEKVLEKDLKKITWDRVVQVIWAITEKFKLNNLEIKE
jgi:hypothetical protein